MNATAILLIIVLFLAIIVIVLLAAMKNLLVKNSILADRIKLYQEFTKRTSVINFIAVLDDVDNPVINMEMKLMLKKYFELVLSRIDTKLIPNLLNSLSQSRHADILMACLRQAAIKDDGSFGAALAKNIGDPANKLAIQAFLSSLPREQISKQYQVAFNIVKENYDRYVIDYPSEHRKPSEEAMREFAAKI